MEYVLLMYGAAFVGTGIGLGLQARAAETGDPLPRVAVWLATAFALVHGASDWLQMSAFLEQREHGVPFRTLLAVRLVLLAASFAALGAFGLALVARRGRRIPAAVLPSVLFAVWALAFGIALSRHGGALDRASLASAEAATRYFLGVPACAAAVVGLDRARRRLALEEWRTSRYVAIAAAALAAYGLFTGLVVPEARFPLSRVLNLGTFAATTHVPVEVFRAAAIGAVGFFLSEAFVCTTTERLRSEVEHLRDGFISLVAHDLRTPLGTVEAGAALLENLPPGEHGSEREVRILRAIRASVRTMLKMVGDLLDASRVESRQLSVAPERLDLVPVLLRLVEWAPADAMRGHTVRLVAPGPLSPVLADPVRVEQVLANLLTNAGKYSTPGSEIVLEAREGSREITVSVTNAGQGIPPADLPRLFSRNYRARSTVRGRVQGLGLGLYIARGLVEAHGGDIWAESEVGRYATFRFTLPLAAPGDAPRASPPQLPGNASAGEGRALGGSVRREPERAP